MAKKITKSIPTAKNIMEDACCKAFENWNRNTDLCMDVKTFLREDKRCMVGKEYMGVLRRDAENHYTFMENVHRYPTLVKRNPLVFAGQYVNVHRKDDGTLYPTFNRPGYTAQFTFRDFCTKAAEELLSVAGIVGKKGARRKRKGDTRK